MTRSVRWVDHNRWPQCAPNPAYPNGIDIDLSDGTQDSCCVELPYPAKRCGHYIVECSECGLKTAITTAGRPDDPRSVTVPCKRRPKDRTATERDLARREEMAT